MRQPVTQVDAFTSEPFRGNPAAVCVLPAPADDVWMQSVAREMNLPETAFLHRMPDGYGLRWFTPATEVPLCGHATLASAHVLWEEEHPGAGEVIKFWTKSGLLTASRRDGWIELDFPARPVEPIDGVDGLAEALGTPVVKVFQDRDDFLVELENEATVRSLQPDRTRLKALPRRGVIVTAAATTPDFDFVSRFFLPKAGIDEDPVTGAAHCCLGPYWQAKLGKHEFVAYQASARGGNLRVRVAGERVLLQGQAVTVLRGELIGV